MRTLFLLPYAGGSSLIYHGWSLPDTKLIPLDYPGHNMDEMLRGVKPLSDFDSLLGHMKEQILSHLKESDESDFDIFGHSMGGLIAYHLGVSLSTGQCPAPCRIYLSGITPPGRLDMELFERCSSEDGLSDYLTKYGRLGDRRMNSRIFKQYFEPVIKGDFVMMLHYPESAAAKSLVSWLSTSDIPTLSLDIFYSPEDTMMKADSMPYWSEYSSIPVNMHSLAGDHFYIEEEAQKRLIMEYL